MNPFHLFRGAAPADTWFPVGRLSSFPEVGEDDEDLVHPRDCSTARPGCKVFNVPKEDLSKRSEVLITPDGLGLVDEEGPALQDQVLIFKHRGKMHAIDHVSYRILPYGGLVSEIVPKEMPPFIVPTIARHPL